MNSMSNSGESYIVYDGECPFCSRYVAMLRLREALGPIRLIDARTAHPVVDLVRDKGFDLNEGMALVDFPGDADGPRIAHGDECIHRLALMSTKSGLFNRLNAAIFRSRAASRILYPVLRTGRNLTLRLLGRSRL